VRRSQANPFVENSCAGTAKALSSIRPHARLAGLLAYVLALLSVSACVDDPIPSWDGDVASASPVIAIDVLLEPGPTMLAFAEANNARLLGVYPQGFPLDSAHRPHITLVHRFVRAEDLDKVYAAARKALESADVNNMKLEAFKFYYAPTDDLGIAGISARLTPELLELQRDVIAAVAPFALATGPITAFVSAHDDSAQDAFLIDYVSNFVPRYSGENFNPHVSTGVAPREYLDAMLTEPFDAFTFSPSGAAVYQLGPFGTAAKKLKEWDLQP
jgi:hypothetical protein